MTEIWIGLLIGVCSSAVAGVILHCVLNRDHDPRVKVRVFDPSDSYGSSNFYVLLQKAIAQAKEEVVQYGEGFSTDLPERLDKAEAYSDEIRGTLRKRPNLRWIRIQTKSPFDDGWFKLLLGLIRDFPSQFKLFVLDNRIGDHLMSVVLVDPRMRCNKVFLLISQARHIGGEGKISVAHTGLMIQGSRTLAEALYDRLDALRDPKSRFITVVQAEADLDTIRKARR